MPNLSSLLDPYKMGEDLPAQLDLVRQLAPLHCTSCNGYHLEWAQRRATTDPQSQLFHNPEFMVDIFAAIERLHKAGHRSPKIFIAGSADTKLLAACAHAVHVQRFFPPDSADFYIMDACETPLHLVRDYAARFGLRLTATKGFIPGDIPEMSANLLVVSGFIRFIPDDLKAPTFARLQSLLTEGGAMAFTQSIRAKDDRPPSRFGCYDAAELRTLLEQAGFVVEREAAATIDLDYGSEERRQRLRYSVLATSGLK